MPPNCRLLPYQIADGAFNMAADEIMLDAALAGAATLRCYGWSQPTVSLGYFQAARVWRDDPLLHALPMVRRPTGGETLVHHHELTYCLALPAGSPWQDRRSWAGRMHAVIMAALAGLGVRATAAPQEERMKTNLCFQHPTPGDVLVSAGAAGAFAKVAGSAQRKRRGAVLQHGAVLLAASPHAPALPGIRELTGHLIRADELRRAVEHEFTEHTNWELDPGLWRRSESEEIARRVASRYAQVSWNEKR